MNFGYGNLVLPLFLVLGGGGMAFAQTIDQTVSPTPSPAPQILSTSPDGKFLVRRSRAEPGAKGEARKSLEICSTLGNVLYAWTSGLGVTTMLWSPDSRYLAVNDMPGEQGDLVRLFALDFTTPAVSELRKPNGKKLLEEEQERHGSFLSAVDKINLHAVEWREGRLWCLLTGSSHPKRQPTVHIPFQHLLVFGMKGNEAPVLEEEWTLTTPREQAYRENP